MKFPFLLGCTSLTYPDKDLVENLKQVPDHFNSIEITLEYPRTLPLQPKTIDQIRALQEQQGWSITIHLPLSLQMTSPNPYMQDASLRTLEQAFSAVARLEPLAYVLHVTPFFNTGGTPLGRVFETTLHQERMEATRSTLDRLRNIIDPQMIAVENLFHNLVFLEDVIRQYDYGVCMDTGHLLLNQADVYLFYEKHKRRIKVIHLHDVVGGKDHQQLGQGESGFDVKALLYLLKQSNYANSVVLEQFKPEHLDQSYRVMVEGWQSLQY